MPTHANTFTHCLPSLRRHTDWVNLLWQHISKISLIAFDVVLDVERPRVDLGTVGDLRLRQQRALLRPFTSGMSTSLELMPEELRQGIK